MSDADPHNEGDTQLTRRERRELDDATQLRVAPPIDDDATQLRTSSNEQTKLVSATRTLAPPTVVTHSATRLAYDPGAQGVALSHYGVRGEPATIPAQHYDLTQAPATVFRSRDMTRVQARLRRKLTWVGALGLAAVVSMMATIVVLVTW